MPSKRLFIYCAGGLGREVLKNARAVQKVKMQWRDILFVDDGRVGTCVNGVKVLSFAQYLEQRETDDVFVIAHGEPKIRIDIDEKLSLHKCRLETILHPSLELSAFNIFAEGCIVAEGVMMTDNIAIERCVYLNLGVSIGHNSKIGAFSTISPGVIISGNVTIGENTYIGTGAIIRDEVTIGKNCIIGMGSIVTKDIPDNSVAYGSPCKVVRENIDGVIFR